jgi:hypothetical protein
LITQCSKAAHSLIIELGLLIIEYYFWFWFLLFQ